MKKLSLIAACAMSVAAFAGKETPILFSSTAVDHYADGTVVEDGEIYALVWTAAGKTFTMDANGNYNREDSKILGMGSLAKGGKCGSVIFVVDSDDVKGDGELAVYLFDTRVKGEDGKVSQVAYGTTGAVVAYNTYEKIAANIKVGGSTIVDPTTGGATGATASVTADPVVGTPATISGITVKAGQIYIDVENTIPAVRYTISGGSTPAAKDAILAEGVNGVANGKITLVVKDPGTCRFFKVVRSAN